MRANSSEILSFWRAARDLRLTDDPDRQADAADELAVMSIYTDNRKLQNRINALLREECGGGYASSGG